MDYIEAFVDSAMERLVAVIRTIRYFVADQTLVDALGAVDALVLAIWTGGWRRIFARVGTIPLVRPITAIVFFITVVRFSNALGVLASEFRRRAGAVFAVTFGPFVGAVSAIVVVIASPVAVDAAPVAARELLRQTGVARRAVQQGRVLIRTVDTVRIAIADPLARNALRFTYFRVGNFGIISN